MVVCVECLPADKPWDVASDTPELWRGAAGLCARVRACAGAAESLHIYIHTYIHTVGTSWPWRAYDTPTGAHESHNITG